MEKKKETRKREKKADINRERQVRHLPVTWQGKEEPNNPGSDLDSLSPVILLN